MISVSASRAAYFIQKAGIKYNSFRFVHETSYVAFKRAKRSSVDENRLTP